MEFKNILELANQPSREECKLASHSEHEVTGHKHQFSSALQSERKCESLYELIPLLFLSEGGNNFEILFMNKELQRRSA